MLSIRLSVSADTKCTSRLLTQRHRLCRTPPLAPLQILAALTIFFLCLFLGTATSRDVWHIMKVDRAPCWFALAPLVNFCALIFRTFRWRDLIDADNPPPFYRDLLRQHGRLHALDRPPDPRRRRRAAGAAGAPHDRPLLRRPRHGPHRAHPRPLRAPAPLHLLRRASLERFRRLDARWLADALRRRRLPDRASAR